MDKTTLTLASVLGQASILDVLYMPPKKLLKGLPERVMDAFMEVLDNPDISPEGLRKGDAYTKLFENEYGEIVYECNPEAKDAGVEPLVGPVGLIYSRYHLEQSLFAHEAIVTYRTYKEYVDFVRKVEKGKTVVPLAYVLTAFLHDIGKKWVAQTNVRGEISCYGHAQCSAYVANQWLKKTNLVSSKTRKIIVAAIYGHDLVKKWVPDGTEKFEEYQELLCEIFDDDEDNTQIRKLIEAIGDADAGVTKAIYDGAIEKGYELTWEHFDKNNGKIVEKTEILTARELSKIINRGYRLIKRELK